MTSRMLSKPPSSMTIRSHPEGDAAVRGRRRRRRREGSRTSPGLLIGQAHDGEDALLDLARWIRIEPPPIRCRCRRCRRRRPAGPGSVSKVASNSGLRRGERVVHRSPRRRPTATSPAATALDAAARTVGRHDPEGKLRADSDEVTSGGRSPDGPVPKAPCEDSSAGGEEDTVAGLAHRREPRPDPGRLGRRDVLATGPPSSPSSDGDVGQAPGAAAWPTPARRRTGGAGWRGTAGHDDGADVVGLEHPGRGVGEERRSLDELVAEAEVGLVGAVAAHGVGVGHPRDGRHLDADQRQGTTICLGQRDDVVLVTKLISMSSWVTFRLAVGAEVLVAVAARDLVVSAPMPATMSSCLNSCGLLRQQGRTTARVTRGHEGSRGTLGRRPGQRRGRSRRSLLPCLAGRGLTLERSQMA